MTAQDPAMATNQMMPLSGQPNRFSFHIDTNEQTTQVRARNTISHRLKIWFYRDFCGYMSSFPQKNKIAILKFSNFLNPRAADLIC
jgi:hypothetical protein